MSNKVYRPLRIDKTLDDELIKQAENENRSVNNHIETVLKKHVSKQEGKPNQKQEYGK